jgi:hypothetical protein
LLPLLREQFNAEIDDAIYRLTQQADELNRLVESLAVEKLAECSPEFLHGERFSIDARPLSGQAEYIVRETLRLAWRRSDLPQQAMDYSAWRRIAEVACNCDCAGSIDLPGNVRASLANERLTVQRTG